MCVLLEVERLPEYQHCEEKLLIVDRQKSFEYLGLNYKKYLRINKKLVRKIKTQTLVANPAKANRVFKFNPSTNLDKLIKIMIENDLRIETDKQ